MKHTVYVCQDGEDGMSVYVGRTKHLEQRMEEHQAADRRAGRTPRELVASEDVPDARAARQREKAIISEMQEWNISLTNKYQGPGRSHRSSD